MRGLLWRWVGLKDDLSNYCLNSSILRICSIGFLDRSTPFGQTLGASGRGVLPEVTRNPPCLPTEDFNPISACWAKSRKWQAVELPRSNRRVLMFEGSQARGGPRQPHPKFLLVDCLFSLSVLAAVFLTRGGKKIIKLKV